jgi:hypothetical protein
MKTARHSGKMGDIVWSLPAFKALGAEVMCIPRSMSGIEPLLSIQPYVKDVWYFNSPDTSYDFDLDRFRMHIAGFHNVADSHLAAFGLPPSERDAAWLTVPDPVELPGRPTVIARNLRYHGSDEAWYGMRDMLRGKAAFVGSELEYRAFTEVFGELAEYYPTPTVMDLARVIAGSKQFVCSQGLPHCIAEGLKKNVINEYERLCGGAAIFFRAGAQYV